MTFRVDEQCVPAEWDGFVSTHPAGNLMQSHGWASFQERRGWTPRFASMSDSEGRRRAAALLLTRRVPGLGRVFYAPRGPVVDFGSRSLTEEFFTNLGEYIGSHGGTFLRCDPYWPEHATLNPSPPAGLRRLDRDWSYWNLPRFVFWLDLEGDEETVMGRMTSRCRNDVRRGYKNGVTFDLGGAGDIDDFHRLMSLTADHKGIAYHGRDYYQELLESLSVSADVGLFLGRHEGEVITAGMSAIYGDRAWLFYAASAPSSYSLRANRTLQWEMIRWAHAKGCVRYDFRGTATNDPPSPDDPGYGVYQFKKSFGPEFTRLAGYYDLVRRPLAYRLLRGVEEIGLPAAYRIRTWTQR